MQAQTHTPSAIFGNHIRYVVPLFQRPYVWNEVEQWQPLWNDISTVAERLLEATPGVYGSPGVPPHFLGAIVLDQQFMPAGFINVRHVIDGQQRLTTLQLLLDAAQWVAEHHGTAMDAQALRILVLNDPTITQHPDEVFKVWPTDRDQDAFRAVMDNEAVVSTEYAKSRIGQAHAFFVRAITEWAGDAGQGALVDRLHALVVALREHLKLVVIDLEAGDNAQVIFETLNHRGAPLLAADLVKNFTFQMVEAQHGDVQKLYVDNWRELDSDYWRQLVAQGRFYRPRIDVFLNYWLTMKLLRDVPTDRIFTDFRDYVLTHQPDIATLLAEISSDARVYAQMENLPATGVEGRFYYRVLRALDTAAVGPALLWLLRHHESELPSAQRQKALQSIESWLVRRALCRGTAKNVNQVVLELLKEFDRGGPEIAGDTAVGFFNSQTADSRMWPTDDTVRRALAQQPVYRNLSRQRLRMVLEALEDSVRGPLGEGQPCPKNLTIEHVMPQAWKENWDDSVVNDLAAELIRDNLVQTLGNLTLVNDKLNPALSNRPWRDPMPDGDRGKRDYLLRHSELKLNAKIVSGHEDAWAEQDIRDRTQQLTERILSIWPRPEPLEELEANLERQSEVQQPANDDEVDDSMPGHEGKYHALWTWLNNQPQDEIPLTFSQVEEILAMPLPPSARNHMPHWYGYEGTALGRAIRDAGWRASNVNLTDERVTFVRES